MVGAALVAAAAMPARGETSWDMPTPYGDKNFHTVNILQFAKDVEAGTGGKLKIKVHSAGSLIKHPEIASNVRRGLVPIGELLMSRLSNEDPVYEVDSVPFLATNYDEAWKLWQASRPTIEQKLEKRRMMLLFAVPWPPQGIYTKKELLKVDDLKGSKFRAYNASTERLAKLAGAVPTQVEVPDIPTAFTTGRVDAMITSPSTGANTKAWDYLSHFHHNQAWLPKNMVVVNAKAFKKLDPAMQKAVLDAAAAAEKRGWEASKSETKAKIAVMRDNGLKVVEPSADLTAGLAKIGTTMTEEWRKKAGDDGAAILAAYEK
ncbi:MAG: TRAP transporter substrate-binding protein [Alphaproteobacteria bacterium]|nr:TRAP transporter substrate-binding protein [Alphaproteobacteria bacterium]